MKNLFCILFAFIVSVIGISPFCEMCHIMVNTIQKVAPKQPLQFILVEAAAQYCIQKYKKPTQICIGASKGMLPFIMNSIWRRYTDPHSVCHKLLLCPKQYIIRPLADDIIKIVKDKPTNKTWEAPTKRKILKVMHISDIHPDLQYTVGAQVKCSEPLCCRNNVNQTKDQFELLKDIDEGNVPTIQDYSVNTPAGYWGSVSSCQLPFHTFHLFLKELEQMDLDLIIWTGDNSPHDVWKQSLNSNLNYAVIVSQRLKKHTNATIIPCLGNHQSWPDDVFDFEGKRQNVLLNGLANAWKPWLTPQAQQSLRKNGFYSMKIAALNNLKVIALNTQAGNGYDWFLLRNPTDPGGQLQWMIKQLEESQKNGQFAYVMGHIAPKYALNDWGMRLNAILDRFSYTIRGVFFGHTHNDHLAFIPDFKNKGKFSTFSFNAPSITTMTGKDPQYRIMDVDYDTLEVIDFHQYMQDFYQYSMRLDKNPPKQSPPSFQHLYSFLQAYNLTDMTFQGGMSKLRNRLQTDSETQIKYSSLMNGGLHPGSHGRGIYCGTMPSPQLTAQCMNTTITPNWFQKIAGPWKDLKHK